jgi:hypothetical protein
MKITQVNNRYYIETAQGRLHVLNEKSLRWNLKHTFGYSGLQAASVVKALAEIGTIQIAA